MFVEDRSDNLSTDTKKKKSQDEQVRVMGKTEETPRETRPVEGPREKSCATSLFGDGSAGHTLPQL